MHYQLLSRVSVALVFASLSCLYAEAKEQAGSAKALSFTMKSLDGKDVPLDKYKGKVVMIVNVASKCGLTPQYKQLQALHEEFEGKGLAILAFPCNQFGRQEPGTASEIRDFCSQQYGVEFDMFAKVNVNSKQTDGENACELYKYLTSLSTEPKGAGDISWNFEKFLLDRNGNVVARFSPRTKPNAPEVLKAINASLKK